MLHLPYVIMYFFMPSYELKGNEGKVGGYMGSINLMANNATLQMLRGKDKVKSVTTPHHTASRWC